MEMLPPANRPFGLGVLPTAERDLLAAQLDHGAMVSAPQPDAPS
jgi:hypothetical protein